MHPVLVEIWKLKIYSYGFMLALSFFTGIWLAGRRAENRGVNRDILYDLSMILIICAVAGSRGLYILMHRDNYQSIIDIVALWQGGAVYYGGLVLAILGAFIYIRRKDISFFLIADICAPSIALGIFITRIGCFLSGCCFGRPTSSVLGVVFPPRSPAGYTFPDISVHPTQLYSSFYGLVIFIILISIDKTHSFNGRTFAFLSILYGIARFIVDFFRYYQGSALMGGLTFNQILSLLLVAIGFIILVVQKKRQTERSVA